MTEPCDLSAVEARALIGGKKLSASELLESCIARIEAVDHAVNAMVARDYGRARAAAKEADATVARGDVLPALHGLPIGVKDLEDVAGLRTTYGSTLFRDHVPEKDQLIVAHTRKAGAIVLGKTNTPEWGAGANTRNGVYGATGNPFDPSLSAAGSSGGSGVALACGMVPVATGSDTGGSLRNPAAYNGIVGFRPTPGLVPNEKKPLGWAALGVLGPMARTVPDLCLLLSTMVGDDAGDPLATTIEGRQVRRPEDFAVPGAVDLASLRVALTPDFGFAPTEKHIRAVFAEKTGLFRHVFARAEDTTPDCAGADESFEVLRALSFLAGFHEKVRDTPDQVGPNVRANVEEGLGYSALDVVRAMKLQMAMYKSWQGFFESHDVILPRPSRSARAPGPSSTRPRSTGCRPGPISTGWRSPMRRPWSGIRPSRCRWGWTTGACRSACRSSGRAAAMRRCWPSRRRWSDCWPGTRAPPGRCRTWRSSRPPCRCARARASWASAEAG